jgi:hypothetical protein
MSDAYVDALRRVIRELASDGGHDHYGRCSVWGARPGFLVRSPTGQE